MTAFFNDERSASSVEHIRNQQSDIEEPMFLSAINAVKIWPNYARTISPDFADEILLKSRTMKFSIINSDWELTHTAAKFKSIGFYFDVLTGAYGEIGFGFAFLFRHYRIRSQKNSEQHEVIFYFQPDLVECVPWTPGW